MEGFPKSKSKIKIKIPSTRETSKRSRQPWKKSEFPTVIHPHGMRPGTLGGDTLFRDPPDGVEIMLEISWSLLRGKWHYIIL